MYEKPTESTDAVTGPSADPATDPSGGAPRPSELVKDTLPDVDPAGAASPDGDAGDGAGRVTAVPSVDEVTEAMRDVVDPELMVNVVDLGLLYGVQVDDQANVTIDMTLTSPTCPLTDRIEFDTQMVLEGLVNSVAINWVWLPPWNLDMITEDGREQLRAVGYNV